jgi:predicted O-methyltransferase YrrM
MNNLLNEYDKNEYIQITDELIRDKNLLSEVNKELRDANEWPKPGFDRHSWGSVIYYLIRKFQPKVVVETGVFYGNSSYHILKALQENNKGSLYSIDLPAYKEKGGYYDENPYKNEEERNASLPEGKEAGFLVPEYLKNRWELILGDAKNELPKLFKKLDSIDMFLHDSLHSYENMVFEFDLALQKLKNEGFIFSDNIDWNNAFDDFVSQNHLNNYKYLAYYETNKLNYNFGAIIK